MTLHEGYPVFRVKGNTCVSDMDWVWHRRGRVATVTPPMEKADWGITVRLLLWTKCLETGKSVDIFFSFKGRGKRVQEKVL